MRCHDCHPLLLDRLYGLLDPADAAALDEHLTGCVDCAAARDREARAAGLFARAAKHSFPEIRFVPPTDAVPSSAVAPAKPERVYARWAVAAAVWALLPATLIPLSRITDRASTTRAAAEAGAADARATYAQAAAGAATLTDTAARADAAKLAADAALTQWVAAERNAVAARQAAPAEVLVERPATVQPGAPNTFAVTVRPRGDALAGRAVVAEVRDAAGAVLAAKKLDPAVADAQPVGLPADVWAKLTPTSELFLTVSTTASGREGGGRLDLIEPIRLAGPVYATLLVTDRATYRPGERVFFRSLTLDRTSFRPPPHEQALAFVLRRRDGTDVPGTGVYGTTGLVRAADGTTTPVLGPDGQPVRGVGVGELSLPTDLPEGEYVLTAAEVPGRGGRPAAMTTPVTRTIRVRAAGPERFAKTITFGPAAKAGEKVSAWAEAKFQGRPVSGAAVTAVATIDGAPTGIVKVVNKTTGADGRAEIQLTLPPANLMPRGDVRLRVTFTTKDGAESVAERVPVAGKDVVVEFFPEGGSLVAGVPNRVYVRATTPGGVPVNVFGSVRGDGMVAPVEVQADSPDGVRGIGVVTLTPKAGGAYQLTLADRPGRTFDLPPAVADGVAMAVLDPVTAPGQPVRVRLASAGGDRSLVVGAYTRGRLSDTKRVQAKAGVPVEVRLLANTDARGGVVRLTVFEDAGGFRPVAERLAFRRPGEALTLALDTPTTKDGVVSLPVAATDENGRPAAAILWAAAVDTAAAPGAADRSLPTHFLLAGEVESPDDLEHADFLLTDHPLAAAGLDRVLATQGWRRFVEQNPAAVAGRSPATDRLLAMAGAGPAGASADPAQRRLFEEHWPRYEAAARTRDAAAAERSALSRAEGSTVAALVATYDARRRDVAELAAAAEAAAEPLVAARGWVNLLAVVLALGAFGFALAALRGAGRPRALAPLAVSAVGAGTVAMVLSLMAPPELPGADFALDPTPAVPPAPVAEGGPVTPDSVPLVPPPALATITKNGKIEAPHLSTFGKGPRVTPLKNPDPPVPAAAPPRIGNDELQPRGPVGRGTTGAAPDDGTTASVLDAARRYAGPIERAVGGADAAVAAHLRSAVPWVPPLVVREYAARRPAGDAPATVLWQPLIVLPGDGRTTLTFTPGAAAGGYEVIVAGHTPDGRIGTVRRVVPPAPK